MNASHPWIGKTIGGCRLEELIGQGGMGSVYKAYQVKLDRIVAVKLLPLKSILASESEKLNIVGRFQREARLAGRLQHPNAVQVYDVGNEDDIYYIVMQYIAGVNLKQLLAQEGPLSVKETLHVLKEVTKVLAVAHSEQIIHRDIKPANIMKRSDGRIVVTDFGLAKPLHVISDLSSPGVMIGTIGYMSPEQAQGHEVDSRSDIYSLGATAFHLLTDRTPFEAKTPVQLIYKQVHSAAPSVRSLRSEVPEAMSKIVEKMLERAPENRYATAEELLRSLESLESEIFVAEHPPDQKREKERQVTKLLPVSLLWGESQLAHRVQRYWQLKEVNPCRREGCGQEWNLDEIGDCKAVLYRNEVWCPQCLWQQFTQHLAGMRIGEIEPGSFGTYWLALKGRDEFTATPPQVFYTFPLKKSKKGWEKMLQRIERGAELVSKLRSTSIIHTGRYTELPEEGISYLPLEYVPAITLSSLLDMVALTQKGLTLKETMSILRKLAQALAVLHTKSIVHRNLSPKSIFITLNGGVRLGNFTMAKSFESDPNSRQITRQTAGFSEYLEENAPVPGEPGSITTNLKAVVGTLAYMAPEQTLGAYSVDHRSDLWSWGVIAFGLLEGKPLFAEKNPIEMVCEIREQKIPKFTADVPIPLQKIVYRALERNVAERHQSASEIKRSLDLLKLPGT